jgi:hypothetical protein
MRALILVTATYTLLVAALLGFKPLWLDELIQLSDASEPTPAAVFERVRHSAGGVPLATLIQHYTIDETGRSPAGARLPAAIFGVAGVFAAGLLALQLGLAQPWIASALFAALPLTLRYSTEARNYSQGVFLSLVATLVFLLLVRRPVLACVPYALTLVLCLYTQPYSVFVAGAHILWSVMSKQLKAARYAAVSLLLAVLAFVPWFIWAGPAWRGATNDYDLHFSATSKTALMIFRELAGGGYWGSGLLLVLCLIGLWKIHSDHSTLSFLLLLIAVPIGCALACDALFDYMIAARQFIWALPAIAILAAAGVPGPARIGAVLVVPLLLVSVVYNVKFFNSRQENWETAAHVLAAETRHGACLEVAPSGMRSLYEFYAPKLSRTSCDAGTVVAAIAPYARPVEREALLENLKTRGYSQMETRGAGGTTVILLTRAAAPAPEPLEPQSEAPVR